MFDLTVASTGINEKTAKHLGLNYDKSFTYSTNHASYYPGAVNMSIKTIFEKETGRIWESKLLDMMALINVAMFLQWLSAQK